MLKRLRLYLPAITAIFALTACQGDSVEELGGSWPLEEISEEEPVIEEKQISEEVFDSPIIEEEVISEEPIAEEQNFSSEIVEEQTEEVYSEPIVEPLNVEEIKNFKLNSSNNIFCIRIDDS